MTATRLVAALIALGGFAAAPAGAALPNAHELGRAPGATPKPGMTVPLDAAAEAAPAAAPSRATFGDWLAWAQGDLDALRDNASRAAWEVAIALGLNTEKLPEPPAVGDTTGGPADADGIGGAELIGEEPPADLPAPAATLATQPRPAAPSPAPIAPAPGQTLEGQPPSGHPVAGQPAARPSAQTVSAEARAVDADPGLLAQMVFDPAARLPSGAYFVPKPTQRLFGVRTLRVAASDVRPTVKLPGRIVPDPHVHGDVEASLLGRIEAGPSGLPVLGTHVARGEVLGYVTPAIGVVDRTQVRREVARLTNEIRLETEAMERLRQFWFVPFRDGKIIQARMKIEGLRRERDALLPMLQIREALRASIDGVVSRSTAVLGRITHPGEMIFEIVDPRALWVEATAQDPQVAELAQQAAEATAATPEGEILRLTFVGSGLTLEQQAVPLLLRIDDPSPSLRVDRPVTVTIRTNAMMRHGIVVPRSALVVGNDGISEVWVQNGPEEFAPYQVLSEDIDGTSVLIIGGLPDGQRVVVQGLKLLTSLN